MPEPRYGEKLEHEGIIIEWDFPKPPEPIRILPKKSTWFSRLSPLLKQPGREARVLRDLPNGNAARWRADYIRKKLWDKDPHGKWTITYRKADDCTYGVWVRYDGVLSDAEFEKRYAEYLHRSRQSKLRRRRSMQAKALKRSMLNPTLRPPMLHPDESMS